VLILVQYPHDITYSVRKAIALWHMLWATLPEIKAIMMMMIMMMTMNACVNFLRSAIMCGRHRFGLGYKM